MLIIEGIILLFKENFFIYLWISFLIIMFIILTIHPLFIAPMFNKFDYLNK